MPPSRVDRLRQLKQKRDAGLANLFSLLLTTTFLAYPSDLYIHDSDILKVLLLQEVVAIGAPEFFLNWNDRINPS